MTTKSVIDFLDRNKALSAKRDMWLPLWQQCANLYHPNRGGFTTPIMAGQETQVEIYDTTPMLARRGLSSAIDGLLKPSTSRWFWMKAKQEALNDDDDAKLWFDTIGNIMWSRIYDPMARFIQHSGAVDGDLATFGLGYLWIGENRNRDGLSFRSLHIGDVAIDENVDGQVDRAYITRHWTAAQAYQRYGDKCGKKVMEALNSSEERNKHKLFDFVQGVYPRDDYDVRIKDNMNMPFASCVVSVADQTEIEQTGYEDFPMAVPRWEVSPGELYPRSPGMYALPDSRTLQAMAHTLLVGGQRAVDPPIWVSDDAMMSAVRSFPGGLNVVDSEAIRATGGKPIGQLEMGAHIPIGREMQDDYRKMVGSGFYKEVFALPQGQEMTATEVMERKEEFIRTIGPTMGQLENDYIGVIVRRVFGIGMRNSTDVRGQAIEGGWFPPPPPSLQNQDANFEFKSPVQQARKQIEAHALTSAFQLLTPLIQIQPQVGQNIDGDEVVRDLPDMFTMPHKWIKGKNVVMQERAAAQKAQAAAAGLAAGQQVADIGKTVADAHHATARGQAANADTAATQQATTQSATEPA